MGPDGFDTFTMRHPHAVHQSKITGHLARCAMTDEVELWDTNTKEPEHT